MSRLFRAGMNERRLIIATACDDDRAGERLLQGDRPELGVAAVPRARCRNPGIRARSGRYSNMKKPQSRNTMSQPSGNMYYVSPKKVISCPVISL